jgi:hypothetical protein
MLLPACLYNFAVLATGSNEFTLRKDLKMKTTKITVMAMGLLLTCLSFVSTARADGARSYIAPSGSDNRPCSRNQPCRTFDAAIAKTEAGGEIVALESGTYEPTTIAKAITLAAAPGADVGIHATTGNAVTITASIGDVVVLRGLRLSGPGKTTAGVAGVLVDIESPNCCIAVHLENLVISNFDKGVQIDLGVASTLMVSDTVFRANKIGVNFRVGGADANGASITRSRFERNDVGLSALNGNSITLSKSTVHGNGVGVQAEIGSKVDVFDSVLTKNGVGLKSEGGHIRMASSSVSGNGTGVSTGSGTVSSMGNNMIINNDIDVAGTQSFITFLAR